MMTKSVVPSNPAFSERHTGHAPSYKYLYSHASGSGCGFLASSSSSFSAPSTLFLSAVVDRRRVQRGGGRFLNVVFKVRRCLETTTTFEMAASKVFWHRLAKKVIILSPKDDASKRSDTQRDDTVDNRVLVAATRRRRSRA